MGRKICVRRERDDANRSSDVGAVPSALKPKVSPLEAQGRLASAELSISCRRKDLLPCDVPFAAKPEAASMYECMNRTVLFKKNDHEATPTFSSEDY